MAGIEVSGLMLRLARRRNHQYIRQGRVELRLASMQQVPYPDSSFDTGFAVNSIQFATGLPKALKEIGRVLKPGGIAALALQPLWKGATNQAAVEIGRALAGAMRDAGFREVEAVGKQFWPRNMVWIFGASPERR